MLLKNGETLVMIGDSVTDCGRARPLGEGLFGAHGNGYVSLVAGLLTTAYPQEKIRVINMGTSGNTIRDLAVRWDTDVADLKPDWLSIMIGINDVWRQFDCPLIPEGHVYLDEYRETLEKLVKETLPKLKGLVLMTPYFMEPNQTDAMRAKMDEYGAVVKDVAKKYNTLFVDTQAEFDNLLKYYHSAYIAWDRVHPNTIGHTLLANAFLKAVQY